MIRHITIRHDKDRASREPRRHQRRGYTLMELVVATGVFITSIGLLAGATTTALAARVSLSRAAMLDAALERLVTTAATNGWEALLRGTFDPPQACPGEPAGAGTAARSCISVNARAYTVTWTVTPGVSVSNVDGIPPGAADSITLTAATTRPDGSTASRARTLTAPTPGYRLDPVSELADGVVRVQLSGAYDTLDSPLLLLSGATVSTVVAAARPDTAGTVVLRAPAVSCTVAVPCRLGLSTGTGRGLTATHGLDAATTVGQSGLITLTSGSATYAAARVYRRGSADVYLQAVNTTSGRRQAGVYGDVAPQPSSVCMWLVFSDGYADQERAVCNSARAGASIPLDTYAPDAAQPSVQVPFPTGEAITVRSDAASATCPVVSGQVYHNGVAWVPVAASGVCSTWTWGRPSTLTVLSGATTTFPNASITLAPGGHTLAELTWSEADSARPAAGASGVAEPVWAKPRRGSDCPGFPTSCAPAWLANAAAASPEAATCSAGHCTSSVNAAPFVRRVTSGATVRTWPLSLVVPATETAAFTLTVADIESSAVTATVLSLPSNGTLSVCQPSCTAANAGQVLPAVASGGTISLSYTAGAATTTKAAFTVRLVDATGATRTETVQLPQAAGLPLAGSAYAANGAQGAATWLWGQAWTDNGASLVGAQWSWTAPSGSSVTAATSGVDGRASAPWQVSTTPAGSATFSPRVTASGTPLIVSNVPWAVAARPGSVTATVSAADQGGTAAVSARVLDASGQPLGGWPVSLAAQDTAGDPARSVVVTPAWCVTVASGSCGGTASVGSDAPGPSWVFKARAGSASGTATGSITRRPARITLTSPSLKTGASANLELLVVDGGGAPLQGVQVGVVLPSGLTAAAATFTTNASGRVSVPVSAAPTAGIGARQVTVSSGDVTATGTVTVTAAPATITVAAASLAVAAGATSSMQLSAVGAQAGPAPGAVVTVTGGNRSVRISPQVTTDASGNATVRIDVAPTASPGITTVTLTSAAATATFQVVVP
jgi:hypothetical protein